MTRVDLAAAVFALGAERNCDLAADLASVLASVLGSPSAPASEATQPEGQLQ